MRACAMVMRLVAAVVMTGGALLAPASAREAAAWAVDPAEPGATLPIAGLSLFDVVTADGIPFPFEALVRKIESRAGCKPGACVKPVLIPLGRSLQRSAASPDFFAHPRAVVAVTGEGAGPMFAKDRLYLGYQAQTNLIEVISYNEAAARFEFQLVHDYRAGGTPRADYASRTVCIACHQNHAPIFSRQVWDETNANPKVAAKLAGMRPTFFGIPVHRGVDLPNAIDDATDRANLMSVTQRIWREACDGACRVAALTAALQYRLSGERGFEASPALAQGFAARWPAGLAIPNPDLPNRDPFAFPTGAQGLAQAHVPASLEPLAPRAPIAVWTAEDPALVRRFVAGLAAFIAETDVRELDQALARRDATAKRRTYTAACTVAQDRYDCAGEITLRGSATAIDALAFGGDPLAHFALKGGVASSGGLRARTAGGDAIERVTVRRAGSIATAAVTVVEDFASAHAAIAKLAPSDTPFSRARMRAALGLDQRASCCEDAGLSAPRPADVAAVAAPPPQAVAFRSHCAVCHATAERSPPNFLAGDAGRVSASLAQCAPRIFVRLAMWQMPAGSRDKVPMPPPLASRNGSPWVQSAPDPAIAALQSTVAAWLRAETGRAPDAAVMLAGGYENLRPCLPAGA